MKNKPFETILITPICGYEWFCPACEQYNFTEKYKHNGAVLECSNCETCYFAENKDE